MKHLLIVFLTLSFASKAQTEFDMFRFANTQFSGSVRAESMGGAIGAIGEDHSSALYNPAGLGKFTQSSVNLSFKPTLSKTTTTFNGETVTTQPFIFDVSQGSVVLTTNDLGETSKSMYQQLSLGFTRQEAFRNEQIHSGEQFISILDVFGQQASGYFPFELYSFFPTTTAVAYEAYALEFNPSNNTYYSYLNNFDVRHNHTLRTRGGITDFYASYAQNVFEKFYWGVTFSGRYNRLKNITTHYEELTDTTGTGLRNYTYEREEKLQGFGWNVKVGGIYMLTHSLRVGLAFHLPTFSNIEQDVTAKMETVFKDSTKTSETFYDARSNYKFKVNTPLRLIGSLGALIGTYGSVNFDAELVPYNLARFRSTNDSGYVQYNYDIENDSIRSRFRSTWNFKLGAEFNLSQQFYLRAGAGMYGGTYEVDLAIDPEWEFMYSGGVGLRVGPVQVDLGYVNRTNQFMYEPFTGSNTDVFRNRHQILLGFNYYFD